MAEATSSSYQSLYRKWRPQSFGDVVAQQYTIKTIQNAIEKNEIGHAYIFAGPRGTGKTSIARIFAKAINCRNRSGGEPCNECDSCQRITRGSELDVIEIDGASNRGIDQIRQLREEVNFAPTDCPYKIYIIDEVHMLTNEAFNALLKTLEEPPKRVIFIFATTEAHKVPPTVMSRCQAFEFRQIGPEDMSQHLAKISEAEGFVMEEGIYDAIARHARGGMRDGLVLLEQLISYKGENEINTEDLYEILGLPSEILLDEFLTALIERDHETSLKIIDDLADRGRDLDLFVRELLHRCRVHLMEKLSAGAAAEAQEEANNWITLTSDLLQIKREMRYAFDRRIMLEVKVLELGQPKPEPQVIVQQQAQAAPAQSQPQQPAQQSSHKAGSQFQAQSEPQQPAHRQTQSPVSKQEQKFDATQQIAEKPTEETGEEQPVASSSATSSTADSVAQASEPSTSTATEAPAPSAEEPLPPGAWNNLIESTKREKIAVHALLKEAAPRSDGSTLFVEFPPDFGFHKDRLEQKDNIAYLREKVKAVFGNYEVRVGFSSGGGETPTTSEAHNSDPAPEPGVVDEDFKKKVELVREIFEGEIVQ